MRGQVPEGTDAVDSLAGEPANTVARAERRMLDSRACAAAPCVAHASHKRLQRAASCAGFARFPQWMWRNTAVLEFIGWLREWNDAQQQPLAGRDPAGGASDNEAGKAGVYGLDLYSMYTSMGEVVKYLDGVDAEAAQVRTRERCGDEWCWAAGLHTAFADEA